LEPGKSREFDFEIRRKKMEHRKGFKFGLITAVLAVVVLGFGYGMSTAIKSSSSPAVTAPEVVGVPMVPANFSDLAEKARPGVVNIQVVKKARNIEFAIPGFSGSPFGEDSPFGRFFDSHPQREQKQEGEGSGFIISQEGFILTNNHVIEDAERIKVKLANGKEYDAKAVGRDPKTDLALVKIDGVKDLHPLPLGNSDALKVGSWVVAIGSPFGLEQTVTQGIVSGKGRVIGSGPYDDFIQTDASINPGNSGGPLINMNGEVVGINAAINPNGQGIGFAIPVNMAKGVIPQLEQKGSVTRGWLGVGIQQMTPALEKSFGLNEHEGALVSNVSNGSPAEKAGIKRGDVITQFDGKKVTESRDLSRIVASTPVGKEALVTLMRDGKPLALTVKVGEMEKKIDTAQLTSHKSLGLTVQELTPGIAQELGVKHASGVVVTRVEPGSSAEDAGIERGDVVQEVNRKPVKDVEDFSLKIDQARNQDSILLLIQRGDNTLFAAVSSK
jgi:serine protease Do